MPSAGTSRLPTTNHYERLGVAPDATLVEIRRAYRQQALNAHPDRRGDGADAAMAEINEAWRVLSDPALRAAYDATLSMRPASRPAPAPDEAASTEPGADDAFDPDLAPEVHESDIPVPYGSTVWTRRWTIGVGFLTLLALAFAAMLAWIALGGGT